MKSKSNTNQVLRTLEKVLSILETHDIEYRVLGSVAFAGLNNGLHREIGDIDLLIEQSKSGILLSELFQLGYKRAGGMFAFGRKFLALETLVHDSLLSVGYFKGRFSKEGDFVMSDGVISVSVESNSVLKTDYTLGGIPFVGIPPRALAVGIMKSSKNPKRAFEVKFLKKHKIAPFASDGIHVKILYFRLDWIYKGVMLLFNFLGIVRTKLGFSYDPWR